MSECQNVVSVSTYSGYDVDAPCGTWYASERYLCDGCEAKARQAFPQGWRCEMGVD